jgi:hypothetical protein
MKDWKTVQNVEETPPPSTPPRGGSGKEEKSKGRSNLTQKGLRRKRERHTVDFLVGLKGDDLLRGLVAVSRGRIPNFSGLVIGVGGNAMLNRQKKDP